MEERQKTKILVVDDESSLRTLLKAIFLSDANKYEVEEACDGNEAIQMAELHKPDLIILDVMMPGQSGFEVCEQIKRREDLQKIKTIILTAKGQETDKEWAKSVGADYFFSKPFSPLDLLNLVETLYP